MCFHLVMLLLCFPQIEMTNVWVQQQTGDWYRRTSQDQGEDRPQRSSMDHTRKSMGVLGGEVTINTLPDNMTRIADSAKYYTWRYFGTKDQRTRDLWVDMSDPRHGQVRDHSLLSNSYKQAVRVALSFTFPFYGHHLRLITIATGGFIFTGDITHRMLTMTQYIAPLMANFDPNYSKESTVKYLDNGEVFVVQWGNVRLSGRESEGAFTFQAALYRTGTITFSYQEIPLSLDTMGSAEHPIKVGLSDAFMVTPSSPQSPAQQIYEYHRAEIDITKLTSYSAVEFTPLPSCLQHDSCELCLSSKESLGCSWCHVLQRCSDGMDRHRQEWLDYSCSEESKNATCDDYSDDSYTGSSYTPETERMTLLPPPQGCKNEEVKTNISPKSKGRANTGVIAGVAAALVLLLVLILVALYISCHPTMSSSLYLTQRRKSYWPSLKFQKKQPGYTEVEREGQEKYCFVEA
ncbi:plexin domain-containing protein 1 [Oryzias latipes]|uniref:Plexin domain containing 1 n=1 Tax=Oryzias latipes TaxID=8090 RepID=A0A3B3HBA0_ORYLA|nr:plexin domain-containing protein 1 [Oryzias latipes]